MKFWILSLILLASAVLLTSANTPAAGVNYVDHEKVAGFLAKGGTMVDGPDFLVQGSHRDKAGVVEVHTKETDVLYFIDGTATVVTGGTVVGSKESAPNQFRGTSIEGGQTHHMAKGDVITIAAGVPHWFKETQGVSYYVVKVKKP